VDGLDIAEDDPRANDVRTLITRHREFAHRHTAPEDVFALDLEGLLDPAITLYSARRGGRLIGIGALKELEATHGELKSMHTAEAERGQGVGRAMVEHLVAVARQRGYERVSLETGAMQAFAPARALYDRAGFTPCGAFGDYPDVPTSAFMTLRLVPGHGCSAVAATAQ
jgi:putative acetyltransferase